MQSRRDIIKNLGAGVATAAAAGGGAVAVAQRPMNATLASLAAAERSGASPWWLLAPLQVGSAVGAGWRIAGLSAVTRGAAILELHHRDERSARVHVCVHDGKPRGLAHTNLFDLVLMDGGQGDERTPEGLGRALLGLAKRMRKNELGDAGDVGQLESLLTHTERVARYGPETLT